MSMVKDSPAAIMRRAMAEKLASMKSGVNVIAAQRDAEAFTRYVMQDEAGRPVELDTFTRFYLRAVSFCRQANRHCSVITPPGLGKSSLSRILACRWVGISPTLRVVITSADKNISSNSVSLCRQIVMSQPYREVFPGVRPDVERSSDGRGWKMNQWFLRTAGQRNDPTMAAVADIPKGESIRVDILLADDLVTESTCEGAVHERICKSFFATWLEGRLSLGGWCLYQQNIRRKDDLAHRLIDHPKFCSIWIGITEDCERMFVKVWNPPTGWDEFLRTEDLDGFEQTSELANNAGQTTPCRTYLMPLPNRNGYTAEDMRLKDTASRNQLYHLNAGDPKDRMLPHFLTRRAKPETVANMLELEGGEIGGLPVMTDRDRLRYITAMGIDLGPESRDGAMSIAIGARDVHGTRYPLEIDSGRWTLGALLERIDQSWRRGIRPALILVENNGLQSVIVKAMQDSARSGQPYEWAHLVAGAYTGAQKWSPNIGLPGMDVLFERGIYVWPNGEGARTGYAHAQRWTTLETNLSQLTKASARKETPDDVMAFWIMDTALQRFSPSMTDVSSLTTGNVYDDYEFNNLSNGVY